MAMVQCENRHFYDNRKHTYCPHCPVPGLKPPGVGKTQAAAPSQTSGSGGSTEPAFPLGGGDAARRGSSANRSGGANVTVGVFQRKAGGVDPVTGWIACVEGVNKGRDYRLHSDRNMIGRAPNMDVCIEGDETISREEHCQIAFSPRSRIFTLIPGTGRNLIYLNGEDVFEARPLKAYDKIDLGESSFLFIPLCGDQFMWPSADRKPDQPASQQTRPDDDRPTTPTGRGSTIVG
jgi:hypothetical protein